MWTRGLDLNQPCVRDSLERHLGRPFDSFQQNASWEPLEDYDPFPQDAPTRERAVVRLAYLYICTIRAH